MRGRTKLTVALFCSVALLSACVSFQNSAGKLLATTATTVDAAMKGWATWVAKNPPNPLAEAKVRDAYQKYQASMTIACNAYTNAVATGERSGWKIASDVLTANQTSLLNLVKSFETIKTK